ncbi:BamD/ComL family (BamD) (PDB:2YHC) [Commensalibacter communis]|uniref:outer membrane protein assembly factor BamD n=1 Tax=Commensalibacter communis TaxID=2972786 RepID=UPI0022FF9A00|nr:outer membrane protein assembly factor BamD [Commensalibacter communis]CAI3924139.1 BamD/ComL family (BamD) (PDB:2YHC) [Commensalibacter communis]CAI3935272.1 BamD/ComL family (BamD) (PDB:2YHC) [Commensalibacter communis]
MFKHISRGFFSVLLVTSLVACGSGSDSKGEKKTLETSASEANVKQGTAEQLYNNGIDAIKTKHYKLATKQFELLQENFPYSSYAPNAQLMQGYAFYLQNKYPEAVKQLETFLQLHPNSPDAPYAFYLRSLCYYERISDVTRDQQSTLEALSALNDVINRFPGTSYARDAQLKVDLCRDHLAGKEMLVGRFYEQQKNYEAAITRFQRVILDYQTTNHVAEALHRSVEVYLKLGLTDQARKTASILGYNYPNSTWYRYTYNDLKKYNLASNQAEKPTAKGPGFFSRMWNSIF